MSDRSAEERQRALLEREARRAGRDGDEFRSPPSAARSREPRRPGRGHAFARRLIALVVLGALALLAWFLISLFQPFKGSGKGSVAVTIPSGASVGQIGDILHGRGVVSSSFFFELRARLDGKSGDLKPGVYTLKRDMSYSAALSALTQGVALKLIHVTIPEGQDRSQVAQLVKADGLSGSYITESVRSPVLNPRRYGARHARDLEGFLFPASYELKRGSSARALVEKQLQAFRENFAGVSLSYARKKNLTPYDVLTIGSMVEREAQVAGDRPLVASVIYNRLHAHMDLAVDATLRFALHDWDKPLTVSQLASRTPYNTRNHSGLPPGPIGNPGLASIRAAAHPARTNYLFYVNKPWTCGKLNFASTSAQFDRDVAAYNAARAKNHGKAPTKC
ncbi:MAG: endolytic transglycosylase MltG [Thermoleophilaceae bacterium]